MPIRNWTTGSSTGDKSDHFFLCVWHCLTLFYYCFDTFWHFFFTVLTLFLYFLFTVLTTFLYCFGTFFNCFETAFTLFLFCFDTVLTLFWQFFLTVLTLFWHLCWHCYFLLLLCNCCFEVAHRTSIGFRSGLLNEHSSISCKSVNGENQSENSFKTPKFHIFVYPPVRLKPVVISPIVISPPAFK